VIPFRDEEERLPCILSDLERQEYPSHLFSVILVNDHSGDFSLEVVEGFLKRNENFRTLELPSGREGKKAALAMGVEAAESQWILQSDADCRLGPGFLRSHMSYLDQYPADLVAGWLSTAPPGGNFLGNFEVLDSMSLTGSGAGSFGLDRPLMCSGANLLYSRALYRETRSFDPGHRQASGDDMFLLIGARKLGRRLRFNPDRAAMVLTGSSPSWGALFRQRVRWGGKAISYGQADIQGLALLVLLGAVATLAAPWLLLRPGSWPILVPALLLKWFADFLLLAAAGFYTGQRRALFYYLPVSLLHPPFLLAVAMKSLIAPARWKGRKVS
jgi:cellulose synthase/poly-beta-1,6-N-acetylglucosamine synthase-like glycosyltransferase